MGDISDRAIIEAMRFEKLPQRARELFFDFLLEIELDSDKRADFGYFHGFDYEECESPIEVILNLAFDIEVFKYHRYEHTLYLLPQYEIYANGKNYRADLFFDTDECESPYTHYSKPLKLIIECDGHDYHEKTKAQVRKNNERDFDLKKEGYDVLHYSGSQIYNQPMKCAREIIEYILTKTK